MLKYAKYVGYLLFGLWCLTTWSKIRALQVAAKAAKEKPKGCRVDLGPERWREDPAPTKAPETDYGNLLSQQ